MTLTLILLVAVLVVAFGVIAWTVQTGRERKRVMLRLDGMGIAAGGPAIPIFRDEREDWEGRVSRWLKRNTPDHWSDAGDAAQLLVHAGFDGAAAPLMYTTLRITSMVLLPITGLVLGPKDNLTYLFGFVLIGAAAGTIGPRAILDRMVERRRSRIRKSIPDSLDLLVVCVEAGVGLDSAMLRVARDMASLHPELSGEFLVVNRRMNAGMTREDAVHGLYERTGVEELRGLSSSMIQSERLGSSIARVLRVYSDTFRRKRKQQAEERAAKASIKMIIPLAIFMLPALFAIVLGPAIMMLAKTMGSATLQ
jgi:tight adherence protein C